MIVAVQGSQAFESYPVFMRAMGVAMSGMSENDEEFYVYSAGPVKVNSFVSEFCNLSERGMKARGKKIRFFKIPSSWIEDNIKSIDYFAFLAKPKEPNSRLVSIAEDNNVEVGVFHY